MGKNVNWVANNEINERAQLQSQTQIGSNVTKLGISVTKGCCAIGCLAFILFFLMAIIAGIFNSADKLPAYTITSNNSLLNEKRSVEVRLEKPATEKELERIAKKIHRMNKNYKRTFIEYRITGHQGVWATTHFNPDLKIQIIDSN